MQSGVVDGLWTSSASLMSFHLPEAAIILMVTPVIMPGLLAHGFDPIWFGVKMTNLMETGLIHPRSSSFCSPYRASRPTSP